MARPRPRDFACCAAFHAAACDFRDEHGLSRMDAPWEGPGAYDFTIGEARGEPAAVARKRKRRHDRIS